MSVSTVFTVFFVSIPALLVVIFIRSLVRIVRRKGAAGVAEYLLMIFSFCVLFFPGRAYWAYIESEREAAQSWALECEAEYGRESIECRKAFEHLEYRGWELEEVERHDTEL